MHRDILTRLIDAFFFCTRRAGTLRKLVATLGSEEQMLAYIS
jgi:hypothetical protein